MARIESRFFAAAASLATLVSARGAWAGPTVMGGYQTLSGGASITEIVTEFQVPNAPAHFSADFAIWTGLQSNSHVIQPVLRYTDQGCGSDVSCPHWEMQNEVEPGGKFGRPVWVGANDWILAYVYLDSNNPGNCNILAGTNCPYIVGWVDLSNTSLSDVGLSQAGLMDFTFTDAPSLGWGLVLETGTGRSQTYNDCTDFPQNAIGAQTIMYQFTWGGLYTAVPTNLSLGYPGVNDSTGNFKNQSLTDGGHVVGTGGLNCGWTLGVGVQSTNVGKIIMGF